MLYLPDEARDVITGALHYEPPGQEIYFVAYVPNDAHIIEDLLDAGHKVTIYDHHHTALHNLSALAEKHRDNPHFSFVFDERKSGATITWAALHPDRSPPPLLKLIEKMDLLTFDSDQERLAACYIDGYLSSPDQEENINSFRGLLGELNAKTWMDWLSRVRRNTPAICRGWKKRLPAHTACSRQDTMSP